MLKLSLIDGGEECTLQASNALIGRVRAEQAETLESGWRQLFGVGLKAYVKGQKGREN